MKVPMLRTFGSLLAAATLVGSLAACAPLVIGGGAVMGAMVAVDRRTTGTQVEDEGIEMRTASRIREALSENAHVNVTSYNRQVLLTGEVPSAADSQKAEQIALAVENVRSVVNDLGVMPSSSLSQRSKDTFITGKVRASLVDAKDLSANAFKVVTERNVVYLMGRVTPREAKRSAEIARGVDGVSKVVRVFEVISEEELSRMAAKPAPVSQDPAAAGQPAK
ncbi:BON domain-containing protein [Alicycliphilus denitrificans]|uniref:Transport-associated protein n=2 Tax=Alicycliphilus denitrificans TaxID=179636 RepID=F4G3N7_ALIDK|nr:BON domain-containing protein [Alicycliphilus denitrificans]GAO21441.1 transport-associated protein [Alicycliphilus sp. B1]ADU98260.1 transport-associated protein [Alicycliphilus denitrificans BC]AEB82865.1 transport-associated protein [Alicycliphilus denitrificans K601]QKD42615.1 BON domain-containing protein [Alicycliphilus denitrificans]GAO26179.1 transport-associated protein [Alicycliphilus sp. B1]